MALSLVEEIHSVKGFFEKRGDAPNNDKLQSNFADSLIQQINSSMSFAMGEATAVLAALKDAPYGDANLRRIVVALDAKVLSSAASLKSAPASPKFFPLRSSFRLRKKTKLQPAQSQSTDVGQQAPANDAAAMPPQHSNTMHLRVAGYVVEEALYNKYNADLLRHSAQKALSSTKEEHVAPKAELNVMPLLKEEPMSVPSSSCRLESDGSLTLTPCHLKADPNAESKHGAAITALNSRNECKRSASGEVKNKPAASDGQKPASGVKKLEPADFFSIKEYESLTNKFWSKTKPPPPVYYGGGKISTDLRNQRFKCFLRAGDPSSECRFNFKTDKDAAFKQCMNEIDNHFLKKDVPRRRGSRQLPGSTGIKELTRLFGVGARTWQGS